MLLHGGQSEELSVGEMQHIIILVQVEIPCRVFKSPPPVPARGSNPHPPKLFP
jgi:hypothetical protein